MLESTVVLIILQYVTSLLQTFTPDLVSLKLKVVFLMENDMSPVVMALIIELVIVPVIKELLSRRGIHGANKDTLKSFVKDPEAAVLMLQKDTALRRDVIKLLADGIDNVGGDIIEALVRIFAGTVPGGSNSDGGRDR